MTYLGGMARAIIVSSVICLLTQVSIAQSITEEHSIIPVDSVLQQPSLLPGSAWLHWTAPGDDGNVGRASGYDLRYRSAINGPIDTESEWAAASIVEFTLVPSQAGHRDSILVHELMPGAYYYFCIKSFDDFGNYSGRSNSPIIRAQETDTPSITGDVNGSGGIDGLDLIFLVNYLKGQVSIEGAFSNADLNGRCGVNGLDVAYLKTYLNGGPSLIKSGCDSDLRINSTGSVSGAE